MGFVPYRSFALDPHWRTSFPQASTGLKPPNKNSCSAATEGRGTRIEDPQTKFAEGPPPASAA